ncbi:microfibril-associated glycoprotein 4-like [Anopheles merus]|uniref:microfibril-associated glycoprotein 4-like n=1 Tax=Anopheles merus TaxID=30066 RepID=UPI001BE404B1|nr:microfibril-associated glycoprotein 4-like [Anopheles merus]
MLLATVFIVFGAVQITHRQQLLAASVDLQGFHFELLLTHLTEMENRLQATLAEIAQNQSQQLEQLCGLGEPRPFSAAVKLPAAGRPRSNSYRLEKIAELTGGKNLAGDWILFQERFNGSLNFNRTWDDYRVGFGNPLGEHWLGLRALEQLLAKGPHELLIVMESFKGTTVYAHYDAFSIGTEREKYAIKTVGKYAGTAGDSLSFHVGSKFTTYDQDNDEHGLNCGAQYGGGWWFKDCYSCFLNGIYVPTSQGSEMGLIWFTYTGAFQSLKASKMMIRLRSAP